MKSYCALAILAVLLGANAQSDPAPSCSKQMELEHRCILNVETSPEAQMIKDRLKQVKHTCVPDYPQGCHAEMEAAHECAITIAKTADTDPTFQESKKQSGPAVDACFDKYPVNIMKGVMEIFMMGKPMHKGGDHKKGGHHHKKHHNATSSGASGSGEKLANGESAQESAMESNETSGSAEKHHGGHHGGGGRHGGKGHHCRAHRHHGPKNMTASGSHSNETSASSEGGKKGGKSSNGGKSGGQSGGKSSGKSGEKHGHRGGKSSGEKPQCRKTEEQKQCFKSEMTKLAKDTAFVDVINTLIHQKQKCKQIVEWSCTAKCDKKKKCIWKATKPCREAFMGKMKTCLGDKGFTFPPHMMKEHTEMFTTPMPDMTH